MEKISDPIWKVHSWRENVSDQNGLEHEDKWRYCSVTISASLLAMLILPVSKGQPAPTAYWRGREQVGLVMACQCSAVSMVMHLPMGSHLEEIVSKIFGSAALHISLWTPLPTETWWSSLQGLRSVFCKLRIKVYGNFRRLSSRATETWLQQAKKQKSRLGEFLGNSSYLETLPSTGLPLHAHYW